MSKYNIKDISHIDREYVASKLNAKSVQISESGCIIWTGAMSSNGYGSMTIDGARHSTHRLAYYAFVGELPKVSRVLHSCDVRCCINPSHLRAGSNSENQIDRLKRGRHHKTSLTESDVLAIRKEPRSLTSKEVAKKHNTTTAAVHQIRNGSSWAWLN